MSLTHLLKALIWSQRKIIVWGVLCFCLACGWIYLRRDDIQQYFIAHDLRDNERERILEEQRDIQRLEKQLEKFLEGSDTERETYLRQYKYYSKPGEHILTLKHEETSTTAPLPAPALPPLP